MTPQELMHAILGQVDLLWNGGHRHLRQGLGQTHADARTRPTTRSG